LGTKADLLQKLDEEQLQRVAKKEGLKVIPRTFKKRDIVKYLDGVLTLEQIKEYVGEYYERETERTIVHERIKEKGIRVTKKETTRATIDKRGLVYEVLGQEKREKISKEVLEEIAHYLHEPVPSGRGFELYDGMSDKMLQTVHAIFVAKESGMRGRSLEFRFANWLQRKLPEGVARLKVRHEVSRVGEIDVIGLDSKDRPLVMAECKDRPVKFEDLDKWLSNVKRLYSEGQMLLEAAYFVSSAGYTQGTIDRIKDLPEVDGRSGVLKMGLGATLRSFFGDSEASKAGKVRLTLLDLRDDRFVQMFPR
jgi:Holliday junction resolvase-like predicted endonuclease